MKHRVAWFVGMILFAGMGARAEVSLPQIFSDGMVLQRDMPVTVWGWGDPGEKVNVAFAGQVKSATADTMGRWRVTLEATPAASGGRVLTVKGQANTLERRDILVGEVWLLVGDHNFNNRFESMGDTGPAGGQLRVAYALWDSDVRYPADKGEATVWRTNGVPQGIPLFFGENLQTNLNVPVGVIVAAQAGVITPYFSVLGMDGIRELDYLRPLVARADPRTKEGRAAFAQYKREVEEWLAAARQGLGSGLPLPHPPAPPETDAPAFDVGNNGEWNVGNRYCSSIHPLAPMALRGVIAHFGEYNARFGATGGYDHRVAFGAKCKAVVQTLRLAWKRPDLPICFLGVAQGDAIFDALRVEQNEALREVPNCDVVRFDDLRADKAAAGRRLAAFMMGKHYGGTIPAGVAAVKVEKTERVDPAQGTGFDPAIYSIGARTKSQQTQVRAGALKLPFVFASNMVLQRDRPLPVWGWGIPGSKVSVVFADQKAEGIVDRFGRWKVTLPALKASTDPRMLTVSAVDQKSELSSLSCTNVLVGDVWLCSGQSNMAMMLGDCLGAREEMAKADLVLVRHLQVGGGFSHLAVDDPVLLGTGGTPWTVCKPETAGKFSAVAYFFAREISAKTGVPIGVINASLGGSLIEPWLAPGGCRSVPELASLAAQADGADMTRPEFRAAQEQVFRQIDGWLAAYDAGLDRGEWPPALPTVTRLPRQHVLDFQDSGVGKLYFGKIYGLVPFALKGVLWYQGESNGGEGDSYFHKMRGLVGGWRQVWGNEFPFYFVQLANFQAPSRTPGEGNGWARLREAQVKALSIPKTGMAVIIDIGEAGDIHPKDKQDVGARLALWALKNDYGQTNLVCSGPLYAGMTITGNTARIRFDQVGGGLMAGKKAGMGPAVEDPGGRLQQFAMAGADRQWFWAEAAVDGSTVRVTSTNVPVPVAVRYAFSQNPAGCNLYNKEGLPASPFRTDEW